MNSNYKSYLLRLQRNEGQPHWRAMLQDATSGKVHHFANEREMLHFLIKMFVVQDSPPNPIDSE